MQATSDLYKSIVIDEHTTEVKVVIAGVEYFGENDLFSVRICGGLFRELSIGGTASRETDIVFMPKGKIPRGAKIELYIRILNKVSASEWIPVGTFFFSTRETEKMTGIMTVHGCDSMLKTEGTFLNAVYEGHSWPMPAETAVNWIADRIKVGVDSRTWAELNPEYRIPCPITVDEKGNESGSFPTMREVLSGIAVASGGNWTITPAGKLLLIGLNSQPKPTNYLVTEHGEPILFGDCRILV